MPLQRRLPKSGFCSHKKLVTAEIRLHELMAVEAEKIDLSALKAAHIIGAHVQYAKVICSGKIDKAVTLTGLAVTKGARAAIEAAGGKVEK